MNTWVSGPGQVNWRDERHFVFFFVRFIAVRKQKKQETHGETTKGRQRDRHGRRGKTRREGDRETVGREPKGVCREIEETEGKPEGDIKKRERVRKRSARRCPTRKNQGFPIYPTLRIRLDRYASQKAETKVT